MTTKKALTTNPFEGKAIQITNKKQLDNIVKIAKKYGVYVKQITPLLKGQTEYFKRSSGGYNSYSNHRICHRDDTVISYKDFIQTLEQPMEAAVVVSEIKTTADNQANDVTYADKAKSLVYGDREADYGKAIDNFTDIAKLWTVLLRSKLKENVEITPEQVCLMMAMLKIARGNNDNCTKEDSMVDLCGYALCVEKIKKLL